MAKSKSEKFELISVTFRLNKKLYSVAINEETAIKPAGRLKATGRNPMLAATEKAGSSGTQCINGQLHVYMCLGKHCKWVNTGIACGEE